MDETTYVLEKPFIEVLIVSQVCILWKADE
jgi:hypothetical protein